MLSGISVEQLRQGEAAQIQPLLFRPLLRTRIFRGVHRLRRIRQRRRRLPPPESRPARARSRRAHHSFWPSPPRRPDAHQHSCRPHSWRGARRPRHRLTAAPRPALRRTRRQPLFFALPHRLLRPATRPWLNRDVHLRSQDTKPGIFSGFLLGFAFAFGWTPCIGPILATVLTLAAASETVSRGVLLLAVYSAGLAVPFLLTAVLLGQFLRFYKNFRKYLHAVELFSGALLLFVGGLVFFNKLTWLSGKLTFLNRFSM